jgi:secreted PhoX family phosphatase
MTQQRTFLDLIANKSLDRRAWFGCAGSLVAAFSSSCSVASVFKAAKPAPLDFEAVPRSSGDEIVLPKGYRHQVLFPWGSWVDGREAPFDIDANSEDQRQQAGMNHDGMSFFPIDARWSDAECRLLGSSEHGYLAMNHEYTDEGRLHRDGIADWKGARGPEKVRKSKAAHGISMIEIKKVDGEWKVLGGRRVTGLDAVEIRGPARGHPLMRTHGDASTPAEKAGTGGVGTIGNCANGQTPWGTYLTCEENIQDYFGRDVGTGGDLEGMMVRYGIGEFGSDIEGARGQFGWDVHDPRFDADRPEYHNNCHRYGWVVEVDPSDPERKPAKRTALGRFRHENAAVVVAPDGRVVVYMADDGRFEYIYKFVSKRKFIPGNQDHNWKILDDGQLFVARFDEGFAGRWIELDQRHSKLVGELNDQAEVLIFARRAADLVGASSCDRPEWITVDQDPSTKKVRHAYASLTNNNKRGIPDLEGPNPANPRVNNIYGHILRWRDAGGDPTATTLRWDIFVTCGYRRHPVAAQRGNIVDAKGAGEQDYGSPDGLWMDPRGILWVESDVSNSVMDDADYVKFGNNPLLAVDKSTGETRRFMVGPRGCEITGIAMTPDYKTMFVNVQHPGQSPDGFIDPARLLEDGAWPNGAHDGRTRSATVAVSHRRGLPIGSA